MCKTDKSLNKSRREALKKMGIVAIGLPIGVSGVGQINWLQKWAESKERFNKTGVINYFDLRDIELLQGDFKKAEQLDIDYIFQMNPDRLLAPFLRESGLPQKESPYGNWESEGLDGHIAGHYLSALACAYASTKKQKVKDRLEYMLEVMKKCQDANGDGYIGGVLRGQEMWEALKKGNIKADGFSLNDRWVPLYNIHKTYGGLKDAYFIAGSEKALDMLVKMTDWMVRLVRGLSGEQIQEMLISEHGGLNEVFAEVAFFTGEKKYMDLAKKFNHQEILTPLIEDKDELTGKHVNTQIPKVIGFKRIAELTKDLELEEAVSNFWDFVVHKRAVVNGGVGVSEHFGDGADFSKMLYSIEGPETCVTYNLLKLAKMLYATDPQSEYIEYYERALYSHILSTQHPKTGGLVYFTQFRPNHYRVYSQPETSMWCCVGSGIENHVRYGEFIYSYKEDDLYVNLFIPSKVNWKQKDTVIIQENNFPYENQTRLIIHPQKKRRERFSLNIRVPSWTSGTPIVNINGEVVESGVRDNWMVLSRQWSRDDQIDIRFPMKLYTEQVPDGTNFYSYLYGPVLLGAQLGKEDLKGLFADESRMGHVAQGRRIPLAESPILEGSPQEQLSKGQEVKKNSLKFRLSGVHIGNKVADLDLEPFYKIHESRYVLYWPQAEKDKVEELQEELRQHEKDALNLELKTIDRVACGEQQPESDHYIQKEDSRTGVEKDRHWRDTKKWFKYRLRNKEKKALRLYIEYLTDTDLESEVFIDSVKVGKIKQNKDSGFISSLIFDIDNGQKSHFWVEIRNGDKAKNSHKILEIRLLLR